MLVFGRLALALAAAVTLAGAPRAAEACSCASNVYAVSPPAGATDVPTNAVILAAYDASAEVALRQVGGAAVPLVIERYGSGATTGRWLVGRPAAPLAPNTPYELTVTVHDPVTTRFTTGEQIDELPSPAGLARFAPEVMAYPTADGGCISSCIEADDRGFVTRIHVDALATPDTRLVTIDILEADGETIVERLALRERGPQTIGFSLCELRAPSLAPDAEYCARATTYDLAGNTAASEVVCSATTTCRSQAHPMQMCTPTSECLPVVSGTPTDDDPTVLASGGGGCSTTAGAGLGLGLGLGLVVVRRRRRDLAHRRIRWWAHTKS